MEKTIFGWEKIWVKNKMLKFFFWKLLVSFCLSCPEITFLEGVGLSCHGQTDRQPDDIAEWHDKSLLAAAGRDLPWSQSSFLLCPWTAVWGTNDHLRMPTNRKRELFEKKIQSVEEKSMKKRAVSAALCTSVTPPVVKNSAHANHDAIPHGLPTCLSQKDWSTKETVSSHSVLTLIACDCLNRRPAHKSSTHNHLFEFHYARLSCIKLLLCVCCGCMDPTLFDVMPRMLTILNLNHRRRGIGFHRSASGSSWISRTHKHTQMRQNNTKQWKCLCRNKWNKKKPLPEIQRNSTDGVSWCTICVVCWDCCRKADSALQKMEGITRKVTKKLVRFGKTRARKMKERTFVDFFQKNNIHLFLTHLFRAVLVWILPKLAGTFRLIICFGRLSQGIISFVYKSLVRFAWPFHLWAYSDPGCSEQKFIFVWHTDLFLAETAVVSMKEKMQFSTKMHWIRILTYSLHLGLKLEFSHISRQSLSPGIQCHIRCRSRISRKVGSDSTIASFTLGLSNLLFLQIFSMFVLCFWTNIF